MMCQIKRICLENSSDKIIAYNLRISFMGKDIFDYHNVMSIVAKRRDEKNIS